MINPFVLLPLYSYPMGTNWDSVYAAIEAYPSVEFQVIVNPSSGPASSTPDAAFTAGVSKLNAYNNTQTLGYIHILDATRSKDEVISEVDQYAAWSSIGSADVHLDGIFFDESPNDATTNTLNYVADISTHARSALAVNGVTPKVLLNPGTPVDDGFYASADVIVAMEEAYSAFSDASITKVQSTQRTKSAFILHSFTAGTSEQGSVIDKIVNGEIPGVYITDSASYNEVSTLFGSMVSSLGGVAPIEGGSSSSASSAISSSATSVSTATTVAPTVTAGPVESSTLATITTPATIPTETADSSTVSTTASRRTRTRTRRHRKPHSTSSLGAEPTQSASADHKGCDTD